MHSSWFVSHISLGLKEVVVEVVVVDVVVEVVVSTFVFRSAFSAQEYVPIAFIQSNPSIQENAPRAHSSISSQINSLVAFDGISNPARHSQ